MLKLGPNPKGQVIYFFGARHTNNPKDVQFIQLKNFWDDFLSESKTDKIVFVEREKIEGASKQYEETIIKNGEAGAAKYLADESGVEVMWPEPSREEQISFLCRYFKPQLVAYAFITRNLSSWFKHQRQSQFSDAVEHSIKKEAKFEKIYKFIPDTIWFNKQHDKLFANQPVGDKNFLDSVTDPNKKDNTTVNKIIATLSEMRNDYIMEEIKKFFDLGKSIFVVYGKGHFISLGPRIKELFK